MLPQKAIYIVRCGWEQVLAMGSNIKLFIARKQTFY